jgi:uncharacterized membrane protein YgdD (TMEM256/DUF423 family)
MTNHTLQKQMIQTGAGLAALSIALGAFGAHSLKALISEKALDTFETGVRYQFYHAISIVVIGGMLRRLDEKTAKRIWQLFLLGIFLFSLSLYILSSSSIFTQNTEGVLWIGGITPFGGLCFIAGWVLLAIKGYKLNNDDTRPHHKTKRAPLEEKTI